jgi:hypothetical protein
MISGWWIGSAALSGLALLWLFPPAEDRFKFAFAAVSFMVLLACVGGMR